MTKITKKTINRLETEDFKENTIIATTLEQIAKAAISENNHYLTQYAYMINDNLAGNYITAKVDSYIKPSFLGLQTKYPQLVETTFTHGNNEIIIRDINKLVKSMLK